jgi:hypothetical protein
MLQLSSAVQFKRVKALLYIRSFKLCSVRSFCHLDHLSRKSWIRGRSLGFDSAIPVSQMAILGENNTHIVFHIASLQIN